MTECDYYMLVQAGIISSPHPTSRDRPENKARLMQLIGLFTKKELITVVKCEQMNKILLDITDKKLRATIKSWSAENSPPLKGIILTPHSLSSTPSESESSS
jgi:hypothetical protein